MRVSRTRFSKRRVKRRTSFPLIAVVQKKRKSPSIKPSSPFSRAENNLQTEKREAKSPRNTNPKAQKKSRATIDYKNVILLRNLITAEGKILPRRINKLTAKQQRSVQRAIKSARVMGLVPFINKSRPF